MITPGIEIIVKIYICVEGMELSFLNSQIKCSEIGKLHVSLEQFHTKSRENLELVELAWRKLPVYPSVQERTSD
ncbi:hypothetical protein VNO78_25503 [Psophocarpus tetragonolobus]|uniref:Uncharacterized protein n=1 Tax=Psophocarpus tetragonolobus TaxID=3891 RepID=A0AAN9S9P3_PSOTE